MTMDILLAKAKAAGRKALTEYESKQLLGAYGVPVIHETVAGSVEEAVEAAVRTGFPVVLKGLGAALLHKTERGLVHLNLTDEAAVRQAAEAIEKEAGTDLEGLLVQPQIQGRREFVAGLFRDPQFGPVVMFGVGGIFTEAFGDVSFRLAPITDTDAAEMLDEIQGKALLGPFRGEAAADRKTLIDCLTGISRIAAEHPEVAEIDINPLLVAPDGTVRAVDALCVLGETEVQAPLIKPVDPADIGALFYPKSIAFVGASAQIGKWGNMLLANTISGGYAGEIYLVNPKGGTIAGRPVFRSVEEIPGHVDLAVVTIPAASVMALIEPMARKGIRNMLLITSGFGETGAAGKALEKEMVLAAEGSGILVLGPNTMGICNPHINLYCTGSPVMPRAGSTAMVAQSGNMGTQLMAFAEDQGIGVRAFSGSGNEAMITIEDYLDGFEVDELTRIVMLYIESVKNGRRFFNSACRVGRKKPIVLLKGGQSLAGNRAASSHTGAMASDARVFDAVCRQAGIVKVDSPMDLLDLSAAFSSLPLPRGKRAAIMTLGGGWGVVTADLCSAYGLEVPELPREMIALIDTILPPYWSRSNPIDIVGENDTTIPLFVMEELLKWDGCDGVVNLGIKGRRIFVNRMADAVERADPGHSKEMTNLARNTLEDFEKHYVEQIVALMEKYGKPVYGVSLLTESEDPTLYRVAGSNFKGVFYETPERAIKAFAKMVEYNRFLSRGRECQKG
ncbi:MAG: acetate--CoA ligase family protein [Desulfobacterales bacterium]|nr:acetate--CoA ligase family protein [Desulfobacterales bacterium]